MENQNYFLVLYGFTHAKSTATKYTLYRIVQYMVDLICEER